MNTVEQSFQYGKHQVKLETGRVARQATSAVMVSMGDTVLLASVVAKPDSGEPRDFFPLTINYQERTYAAGKIPGGYFKREGRPTTRETLICRLIDRPVRPLFPKGFVQEVQVVVTLMSLDTELDPDIPAMIGASAALTISGIPFKGPLAAARVGYIQDEYVLNPTLADIEQSRLDLVVAGTKNAVLMVESEAHELAEDKMLGAVMYGHQQMQVAIDAINEFAASVGREGSGWQAPEVDTALQQQVATLVSAKIEQAYMATPDKLERQDKLALIRQEAVSTLCTETEGAPTEKAVKRFIEDIESQIVRSRVLAGEQRIDGRDHETVRPINIRTTALPRAHGSAIFTRGETQAIVVATLGTERDAQLIDELAGDRRDTFMLHYNFPPYCVGEVGFMSGPKRREIGHGNLAKRAVTPMLPTMEAFPYVIRVVSEITESNGSSSMASVCGASLAMMDAGVPIKAPVAGIAMGLVKEGEQFAVLTDILGDEDHLGDMDFKVAGTEQGITALQMDIKIDGITEEIMKKALAQAKAGRLHILNEMKQILDAPRSELSQFAPRIITVQINPEKIRDVIGKGGAVIRELTETTGTNIDIADDGLIRIAAVDTKAGEEAKRRIEQITADVEIGVTYEGRVAKVLDFGAFVNILPGKDGLLHISQICNERVENIHDKLREGQIVRVKVLEIDRQGRVRLSMKQVESTVA